MLKLFLATAVSLMLSGVAHAQCTPEGNARFAATERRIQAAAARIRAGDCSAIADWKSGIAAQHAILLRSQRQTYPYTCTVTFKNPSPPRCAGNAATAAKSAAEKKQATAKLDAPLSKPGKTTSCSDITGTSSKGSAARACNQAKSALNAAHAAHKKDPARSAEQYKKAAEAYRKAGDTARADAILKGAGLAVVAAASNPPAETSGASKPSSGTPPVAGGFRIMWSGRKEDCDKASLMEQNTAGWYDMCVEKATASLQKTHTPSIDPQVLFQRARETCKNATVETRQRCITDAKVAILLSEDLAIRSECGATTGDARIVCVHGAYLYGPGGSDRAEREERWRAERIKLEQRIAELPGSSSVPAEYPGSPEILRDRRCSPGSGMKPTPGAFGAWSCQPLGIIYVARDRQTPGASATEVESGATTDRVHAFEKAVVETAATAAVSAVATSGASMPTPDREACMITAFGAAYGVFKGGAPAVPEQCRPMAQAARAELIHYAVARIDTRSNPGVEELLTALAEYSDQIAGANASPSSTARVANDCARAETHWKSVEEIRTLAAYEDHLSRFQGCEFATLAAARIQALKK